MQEIVDWLVGIEELAGEVYGRASRQFQDDDKLSSFLNHLAEDEAWHFHVMGSASDFLRKNGDIKQSIFLDDTTKNKIGSPFHRNLDMLLNDNITIDSILDCITETEFSEWNHIFLFVVDTLKETSKEFMYIASKMQSHLQMIKHFLVSIPEGQKYVKRFKTIPDVWKKKILIVDDSEPVVKFLSALLEEDGSIDTANNGAEGLSKLETTYYDAIISDVNMPSLDGISFYKEAHKNEPNIRERFIFFTSSDDKNHLAFFNENDLSYMTKPLGVDVLHKTVHDILSRTKPHA